MVRSNSEVLPAPGELIRLMVKRPASSKRRRLAAASRSLASRMLRTTGMITCVIFISSLALNAGDQQFPATDQINRWFLTMRTCEFLILDGKNLVAPLAA